MIQETKIAAVAPAERGNPGINLIVNDEPLALCEWLPAFAKWLNAPPPPQISVEDALNGGGADAVYYGTQMRDASSDFFNRGRWSGSLTPPCHVN
jgi:hypothetical protein